MLTPGADPVRQISIIPRGQSLGATYQAGVSRETAPAAVARSETPAAVARGTAPAAAARGSAPDSASG
jgi:hypothetical protein